MGSRAKRRIGFLLLGGIHHIYHLVPVAAEMAKLDNAESVVFVRTASEARMCRDILDKLGGQGCAVKLLSGPGWLRGTKVPLLMLNLKVFQPLAALVTVERTSTFLKQVPGFKTPMIHIPHGAGDRAQSYDERIAQFDFVIPAGPKDRHRMIELGLVTEETSQTSGYVKTSALAKLKSEAAPLFDNARKTVLYSPHFDKTLSTWPVYGEDILKAFAEQDEFNLIFAPHIRLFKNASETERRRIEAYSDNDKIKVDLGSPNSIDMTYTLGADIYIGDASSQVYEFLSTPKPCVFFGPDKREWKNDPDYAHWRYGDVVFTVDAAMQALEAATDRHDMYINVQVQGVAQAFGQSDAYPPKRAANIILDFIFKNGPEGRKA